MARDSSVPVGEETEAVGSGSSPSRVAYIWSQELQDVSDQLPANRDRSSLVHGLIQALDLLDFEARSAASRRSASNTSEEDEGAQSLPNEQHNDTVNDEDAAEQVDDGEDESLRIRPCKGRAVVIPPEESLGSPEELERYHDVKYVDYLMQNGASGQDELRKGNAEDDGSTASDSSSSSSGPRQRKRLKTSTHGLEHILADGSADIAISWDGGRHHALRNRASGFCYVADVVLGIMRLVRYGKPRHGRKGRPRVLYLDLDIHYGDGVAQAFLSPTSFPTADAITQGKKPPRPPQVLTLSVHHHAPYFFPPPGRHAGLPSADTPNPFTLSIPLKAYPSPQTYATVWSSIERVKEAFDPDYVVLQLGVDGLPGDRVGQYGAWSLGGEGGLRWCVEQVKHWGSPLCVLGGGGYDHANAARAWAVATASLVDRDLPLGTDIPHHDAYPAYAPSFTLDIPPSHVQDENDQEHLDGIDRTFRSLAGRIGSITEAHR